MKVSSALVAQWRRQFFPKAHRAGSEWRFPCPVHQGKNDSFALNADTGAGYCHSTCGRGFSLVDLHANMRGMSQEDAEAELREMSGQLVQQEVACYPYHSESGELLYEVVRLEPGKNGRSKDFRIRRYADGVAVWNLGNTAPVLFRLKRVLEADTVVVVEGEKCALALERLGVVATTNHGGAGKWKSEHTEALRGKHVIVCPDQDAKGIQHGDLVAESVRPVARSLVVVHLPVPDKGDIVDWLADGHTLSEFWRLVEDARGAGAAPAADAWNWRGIGRRFSVDQRGVFITEYTNGKPESIWCCAPIETEALVRTHEGGGWGLLVSFMNRDNQTQRCIIQHRQLLTSGTEALSTLTDAGFRVALGARQIGAVKDYLNQAEPAKRAYTVDRIGWAGRSYVLPDQTIAAPDEKEPVLYDPGLPVDHKYRVSGSLDEWRRRVAAPCAGNHLLEFALGASFGAAVVRWAEVQGAGFHYLGASSVGKSTGLRVAGSLWGGGRDGVFYDTWRATVNGLEAKGLLHNDALLGLDEMGELEARDAYGAIYLLSNGGAKARMTKSLTARRASNFNTLLMSTGELSTAALIAQAGREERGGQAARLVNISADARAGMGMFEFLHGAASPKAFADSLRAASRQFFGSALRPYLTGLVNALDEQKEFFLSVVRQFEREHHSPHMAPEVSRVLAAVAVVVGGGALGCRLGLLPAEFSAASFRIAAGRVWHRWIEERGSTGALDIDRGCSAVLSYLLRFGTSRFQDLDARDVPFIADRAGFKQRDGEGWRYWLPADIMAQILAGLDVQAVAAALKSKGMLETAEGRLQVQKRVPGVGRPLWFYCVRLTDDDSAARAAAVDASEMVI